ncbi:hypothetical protein [Peribacillus alkalitolerans]|uniref:hypothetical protein n=1 Tax=Peribacillus alkalitolerans TaxID=1550385 RepID=UPI0013D0C9C4|nr:hypothetical protein [Peribacillus alkalitolerans]
MSFIGMSLSKALNTGYEHSSFDKSSILLLIILLVIGCITMIGAFKLKNKTWSIFFIGFCIALGIVFIVIFLFSFGSLGYKNELFILCVGIIYLGLGYLAIRKK